LLTAAGLKRAVPAQLFHTLRASALKNAACNVDKLPSCVLAQTVFFLQFHLPNSSKVIFEFFIFASEGSPAGGFAAAVVLRNAGGRA